MSYKINSDKLAHPLLKPILQELDGYFKDLSIQFFVIGATARDIVMEIHNEKSGRLTHDLDIAIAINDWDQYAEIEKGIVQLEHFKKDTKQKQRFIYKDTFQLDVVPFGNIMKENDKIFWPPDEQIAMSVLGFPEVKDGLIVVRIDEEFEINIISLAGIFVLKIVAWKDRHLKGNKDADDIGFILINYLGIYGEKAIEKYEEIYETDNFSTITAGAKLLGDDLYDILKINIKTKEAITKIIKDQHDKAEDSELINQILETNRIIRFEELIESLLILIKKLEK
ncbi:nucleotidyl transferase AbiEii/AbiGii toxin family protein [Pedobacter sp. ISL-68]|uniref:nucleotidyl transferase AbiEii/AbiGii toxin family protein n=1 Tax=unclassified Pedobacter TaxID=2628915 RepID=UPI001BE50219|nr:MULTISPECIES: nucleotidyl transferase AbiEii/AbiGii toxin family protein [unclassified Pedobacter]MBT2564697.1 nucleotidyl transferase AbiEii/AbiGii toxin family protein [Pedobacter sp. ISL-64]MBT2592414.1 nucleotidyl transferase AbiEii/AbiGii toxin family protein [Pedobacter sp. ISL-68]